MSSNATVTPIRKEELQPVERPEVEKPKTDMDTRLLTPGDFDQWQRPRFQRPVRVNAKVIEYSNGLKQSKGIMAGVLTLGQLPDDPSIYIVDGSHRIEAAKLSELAEFLADVRVMQFKTMAEMAKEFVRLNQQLVRMRPDDILRGLEENVPAMRLLREECPMIGYDNVRRNTSSSPVVSMSALLRCWFGSNNETPTSANLNVIEIAEQLDDREIQNIVGFMTAAYAAWRNDPEYYRLWANLNLTMCMWMYRQCVLRQDGKKGKSLTLNLSQFGKCLMSVSAAPQYVDWLMGRNIGDRDRSPCYTRLKTIFIKRLIEENYACAKKPMFPSPEWHRSR